MKRRSNQNDNWDELRDQIIGLGERSLRKSYYPELKQRLNELERYLTIFQNSNDAIVISDLNGNIYQANPAANSLFRAKPDEEVTNYNAIVFWGDSSERDNFIKELTQKKAITGYETRLRRLDGKTIAVSLSSSILESNEGTRLINIIHDVTEKNRFESQLRQAQKMEALGTLAGGIAHDFNNILSAIIGYTELLKFSMEVDTTNSGFLEGITKAAYRARDLVSQILTFSRQSEQEFKPVQFDLIIKETLMLLKASLPVDIEIVENIQEELFVFGDPSQLHQVIMNLCVNASHAMQDKGGRLELTLDLDEPDRDNEQINKENKSAYIHFSVRDNGSGISPSIVERIFDPFFTTKEKGKGTGLGLSVVHGIIKSHNGTINVESVEGLGTCFHIYLPILKQKYKQIIGSDESIPKGNEHILFVDDEEPLVEIGKRMLDFLGYKVTPFTSSLKALEKFKEDPEQFDLVIADLSMPKMGGEELAKCILSIRPNIPIILCTGYSSGVSDISLMPASIKAIVLKPLIMNKVAKTVRSALDSNRFE